MRSTDLEQIRRDFINLERTKFRIAQLQAQAERVSSCVSHSSSPRGTFFSFRREDAYAQLVDLKTELERSVQTLEDRRLQAALEIDRRINNVRWRCFLHMRFIDCWKIDAIAYKLGYSNVGIYKIRRAALIAFDRADDQENGILN